MRKQYSGKGLADFSTEFGWMAAVGSGAVIWQLTFGHESPQAARGALDGTLAGDAADGWNPKFVERLTAYAEGRKDDFHDVPIELGRQTDFQQRVVRFCRAIPYGQTLTYGQVADMAGCPRAARAVGNVMAINRIPLVVPCHRVVAAGGGLGGYSAGEGVRLKLRLLELEQSPLAVA